MEPSDWQDVVLYPVPIDRIAEVRRLLATPPSGTSEPGGPTLTSEERIAEILTSQAAAG